MAWRYARLLVLLGLVSGCNMPAAIPVTRAPSAPLPATDTPFPTVPFTPTDFPADTPPASTTEPPPAASSFTPTWTFTTVAPLSGGIVTPGVQGWQAQVIFQEGRCCVGGMVGASVMLSIAFDARGPGGPAREMRYQTGSLCVKEAELSKAPWQPLTPEVSFELEIPTINWTGFWVSAQFRDPQGNLSPVVCDDISVEGMPAPPTPSK